MEPRGAAPSFANVGTMWYCARVDLRCATASNRRDYRAASDATVTKKGAQLSVTDEPISFEQQIKPLFRERDRQSMTWAFDLWSRDDVAANGEAILGKLRDGTMPCDGAWSDEQIAVFQRWVEAGSPA